MRLSKQRWVLVLAAAASFIVGLDSLVVTTALPTIRHELGASLSAVQWTVNAYTLSFAVLLMSAAALGDRYGRRRVLCLGVGLFGAASVACALAPNAAVLVAARAGQGAGAAFVMPLALGLLTGAFAPRERPRALGIFAAAAGAAVALGPPLGGAVVQGLSWPFIFWLNVPLTIAIIVLARARVDEQHGPRAAVDIRGAALLTTGSFLLVWGLVRANTVGWGSLEILTALVAGLTVMAAFVWVQSRLPAPMLPVSLFRSRSFTAGSAAIFFLWGSGLGGLFFMTQLLQTGLGDTPLSAGLRLMPWGAVTFTLPALSGRLITRYGEARFIAAGAALHAVAFTWVALVARAGMPYGELVPPLILSGCGFSLAMPATQSAVLTSVALEQAGKASGALSMIRQLGGAFGLAIQVAAFAAAGSYASRPTFIAGARPALAACAGLGLLAATAGTALHARRRAAVPRVAPAESS
ncbi:MAG TPA: MFS transporter [Solirubrobacteraceae bacterium]|nr:MFS transporter [Solirubrobacteraceae bacterium]